MTSLKSQVTAEELSGNDDYVELAFSAKKLDDKVWHLCNCSTGTLQQYWDKHLITLLFILSFTVLLLYFMKSQNGAMHHLLIFLNILLFLMCHYKMMTSLSLNTQWTIQKTRKDVHYRLQMGESQDRPFIIQYMRLGLMYESINN